MNKSINTPCIRNCCLDDNDVCMGCFRTMSEIMAWSQANNDERESILKNVENRRNISDCSQNTS